MRQMRRAYKRIPFLKRLALLAGILVFLLLGIFAWSTLSGAKYAQAAQLGWQTTYESVYISSGDSLWSIAQEYRGTQSTAVFVRELKELNGLSSDDIQAGYYLLVPVSSMK